MSSVLEQTNQKTATTGATFNQSGEPRTFRQATENDLSRLSPHKRRIADILRRNENQFVSSSHLKFATQTKHAPRRVSEIQAAGFRIEVRNNGGQNEYRWTGEVAL